jgi:hypothetical protein
MEIGRACFKALVLTWFLVLSGCVSTPNSAITDIKQERDGLSARNLATGECGVFVWTGDTSRRFILFSQSGKRAAVWDSPDGELALKISEQSGPIKDGQYPKQTFVDPANSDIRLTLNLRDSQIIASGTRYKSGTFNIKKADEWDRVIPVVGLSMCQR